MSLLLAVSPSNFTFCRSLKKLQVLSKKHPCELFLGIQSLLFWVLPDPPVV